MENIEEIKQIAYDFTNSKVDQEKLKNRILNLFSVGVRSEQLCECAMPEPIDPFAEVDKDTCKKCSNLIA